jgi:YHS domain-containing protein
MTLGLSRDTIVGPMTRRALVFFQIASVAAALAAGGQARNVAEWNVGKDRLAIQGYDPVAYFPEDGGVATKGDEKITVEYEGVVYRFASAAHREKFLASPSRYEASHGGWCSYAMLEGDKVQVDPKSFIVKDGRLFLFYKGFLGDTRAKWLKADPAAETKTADAMWKKISGESARAATPSGNGP